MKEKFRVEFLEEAVEFLETLDDKAREKVLYNVWKARITNDKELFKKLPVRFGNSGRYSKRPITDYSPSGINLIKWIQ